MAASPKLTYENNCLAQLQAAVARLDRWRESVHHFTPGQRVDAERALDCLRGLCNRVLARLEDVRRADGDSWEMFKARADQALRQLIEALDRYQMAEAPQVA
ncbi:MAG: hypothetical protein P4M00_19275 [Azospirillaceae bacterium]|nr:hypothetical protein [Azospirillaceae bacterium]